MVQPLWRTVWRFLKKVKIELPYDPAIALLGIYPKDTDVEKRRAICTPMFIAEMAMVAKLWKESRCPSRNKISNQEMGTRHEQIFLQRRHPNGQQTHEKVLHISRHQGNTNQKHNEIPPHTS